MNTEQELASFVFDMQAWCRKHRVPYVHGCLWDRECRSIGAPRRVSLMLGQSMVWVDLPGYYRDFPGEPRSWHGLSFGSYSRAKR